MKSGEIMKKVNHVLFFGLLLLSLPLSLFCQELAYIEISPDSVTIAVDDSIQFTVTYYDTNGVGFDTTATWDVHPQSKGSITDEGWFYANSPGECLLSAQLGTFTDEVIVTITPPGEDPPGGSNEQNLIIIPADTVLVMGTTVQFEVFYADSVGGVGEPVDSLVIWSLLGMPLGTLSDAGHLTVDTTGYALVKAQIDDCSVTAYVVATDGAIDTSGVNNITITRDSPNPQGYTVIREIEEGGNWKISGLPHPMNILNGGNVYFPPGCISEDIRIHMALPGFFRVGGDTVQYGYDGIVAGVQFRVMTDDTTIVEPYYFDTPLFAGLVFKRGLLANLGIEPGDLSLYFTIEGEDTLYFDSTGIGYTTVDTSSNCIYSSIAHFSDLVVAETLISPVEISTGDVVRPSGFALFQNFPNPFNPVTTIRYEVPHRSMVTLTIFDVTGRAVTILQNSIQTAGTYSVDWNGLNENGMPMSSGIYLARMHTGDFSQTIKMVYLQ